jgi:hypothetical protein
MALLVVGVGIATALLLPSDEDLRRRLVAELNDRYPVTVTINRAHWQLLPRPLLSVQGVVTQHAVPVRIDSLTLHPQLDWDLLRGRPRLARVVLDDAQLPTQSLRAFRSPRQNGCPSTEQRKQAARLPLKRFELRNVVWISQTGVSLPLEGEIEFQPDWRPGFVEVRRSAYTPVTDLRLDRDGSADRWAARFRLGGGVAKGALDLRTAADCLLMVTGTLRLREVDVELAAAGLNRRTAVGGQGDGTTKLGARGYTAGQLGSSLRLRTAFAISPAKILRFDFDKAVRTLGRDFAGTTTMDSLAGVMDLQNTPDGTVIEYSGVSARAERFLGTGQATVFNRRVEGDGKVAVLKDLVNVPFHVSGPTWDIEVSLRMGTKPGAVLSRPVGTPKFQFTPLE